MSIIALFNAAKDYLHRRHTDRTFRHLDDHYLRDIGFYREEGHIRPLSGKKEVSPKSEKDVHVPPGRRSSDG